MRLYQTLSPRFIYIQSPDSLTHSLYSSSLVDSKTMLHIPNLQIPDWDHDTPTAPAEDLSSTDHFRMFDFKVSLCKRGRPHDWTDCPYAHPGEKARRRDPRKHHYSATPCPEFRRGGNSCHRGDSCLFAHGVFECWLHPSRYRTQPCKDGTLCRRRVCFFAHTTNQLRLLNHEPALSSPTSVLNSSSSLSPKSFRYGVVPALSVGEIVHSMRNVQLDECEEEPAMERVESGRDLRSKIYSKLSMENSQNAAFSGSVPDFGWVSELLN